MAKATIQSRYIGKPDDAIGLTDKKRLNSRNTYSLSQDSPG